MFTLAARVGESSVFDTAVIDAVSSYCDSVGISGEARAMKIFTVRAIISGAVTLMNDTNVEEILALAKAKFESEFN